MNVFRSSGFEDLGKQELVVCLHVIVGILGEGILRVVASRKLSWAVWLNPLGSVVSMENVEKFFQS